ncbi:hypothetical protein [Allokutzneria sp. NRRL B-24872]|uniref:hypothetical protein n=1 Tax=Allokutzneria sp. NRRL B-24872 TaxID=1137961 RepID=UPI00117893BC|nr:hypothetical protein [Allokutzneria sp. NRRL B-24872]
MEHVMEFYLLRVGIIAAVVVGLVILGIVLLVALKKLGLLGQAKNVVGPVLQRRSQETGLKGTVAKVVLNRLDDSRPH